MLQTNDTAILPIILTGFLASTTILVWTPPTSDDHKYQHDQFQ